MSHYWCSRVRRLQFAPDSLQRFFFYPLTFTKSITRKACHHAQCTHALVLWIIHARMPFSHRENISRTCSWNAHLPVVSSVADLNFHLNRAVIIRPWAFFLRHAVRSDSRQICLRVEFAMSYFGTASPNPWVLVLDALEKKVNRHSYETWLKPTRFSHSNGPTLFVRVPNSDFCHIGEKYGDLISEAIENLGLEYQDVEFVTDPEQRPKKAEPTPNGEVASESSPTMEVTAAGAAQQRFDWDSAAQLNPKYTFDGFVIGSGNQFAHAAARAVAERPSKAYNPLFLYGGVGMGKTHLMQAIGHEIKKRNPQMAICYLSAEKFTNEMINALRNSKMTSFRDKYRNMDVLLVDDIQFLASKERTQEEFFHTFNALHESMPVSYTHLTLPTKRIV